jgi:hypothetical protein
VTLSVRARTSEAIGAMSQQLTAAGYSFRAGRLSTASDPFGLDYPYSTDVRLIAPAGQAVDPTSLETPKRPQDDDSQHGLHRAGGEGGK